MPTATYSLGGCVAVTWQAQSGPSPDRAVTSDGYARDRVATRRVHLRGVRKFLTVVAFDLNHKYDHAKYAPSALETKICW